MRIPNPEDLQTIIMLQGSRRNIFLSFCVYSV